MKRTGTSKTDAGTSESPRATALADPPNAFVPPKATRSGATLFAVVQAAVVFIAVAAVAFFGFGALNLWVLVTALVIAVATSMTVHIAMEWERIVIFRFGAFNRVAGPGLIFMIPVIEQAACRIDMRTIATTFGAEKTLTSDLVPVDIVIPEELQDVMSLEAQAEREKNARLVLASAEQDISEMISASSDVYENNDSALKIRTMHLLYESIKKSGGTVVTVPSSLSDGLGSSAQDVLKGLGGKE